MDAKTLGELAGELAPLDHEARRRHLCGELDAAPEGELPAWLREALVESRHLGAAAEFASKAHFRNAGPLRRASAKMLRTRYRSEETGAAILLGLSEKGSGDPDAGKSPRREGWERNSVLLDESGALLLPPIRETWNKVCGGLEIDGSCRLALVPARETGVKATLLSGGEHPAFCLRLTTGTLSLPVAQLSFLIGRSLGSLLFDHDWYLGLSADCDVLTGKGQLSPEAEAIWLRWRLKADISADRAGLLACEDYMSATGAMLRSELGLTASVLPAGESAVYEFASRLRSLPGSPASEDDRDSVARHPLALRVAALKIFAETGADESSDESPADGAVDKLLNENRRHPRSDRPAALMNALAAGGVLLLVADRRIDDREGRLLVRMLFRHFTDYPETVLARTLGDPEAILAEALDQLRAPGSAADGKWLVERLLEIAMVDESAPGPELSVVASVAESLNVGAKTLASLFFEAKKPWNGQGAGLCIPSGPFDRKGFQTRK